MLLREKAERIEILLDEGLKYLQQAKKELTELKEQTDDTLKKINEDKTPDLPFNDLRE